MQLLQTDYICWVAIVNNVKTIKVSMNAYHIETDSKTIICPHNVPASPLLVSWALKISCWKVLKEYNILSDN